MPWLTPPLREAIGQEVLSSSDLAALLGDRPRAYLDPNLADVRQWLWQVAGRCRARLSASQLQLVDRLKAFADGYRGDDAEAARTLDAVRREFVAGNRSQLPAADLHTVALLEHRVAVLGNSTSGAEEAKKTYDKALEQYALEKRMPVSTRSLCLVDSAVLFEKVLGDGKQARQRLDEALAGRDLPLLFQVSTLAARGELAAAMAATGSEYEDYRFHYAKTRLASCDALKAYHPLAAYLAERYAWSLMDQWKVEEASKQFQAAFHIRLTEKEERDPSAAICLFQDRLGLAMASRYRGNLARRGGSARASSTK